MTDYRSTIEILVDASNAIDSVFKEFDRITLEDGEETNLAVAEGVLFEKILTAPIHNDADARAKLRWIVRNSDPLDDRDLAAMAACHHYLAVKYREERDRDAIRWAAEREAIRAIISAQDAPQGPQPQ